MPYLVDLCLRPKGQREYHHLGAVDIGEPPGIEAEQTISLPGRGMVRVRIDKNHLIPVHEYGRENPPVLYVTEL